VSVPLTTIKHMIESDFTPAEWLLPDAGAREVLDLAAGSVVFSREADRLKVRTVLRWAELHPAGEDDAACWGDADGSGCDLPVGREGCPQVMASSVADLAGALAMTTAAGLYLLDACLELKFRLRRIHRRFEALEVDLARVRQVTSLTQALGPDAAAYVDEQLAWRIDRVGRRTIEMVVKMAIVRFHPELADEKAGKGKAGWHVDVHHPEHVDFASTSQLDASADSLDLEDFMAALSMIAEDLARDGDADPQSQRLAKSLGVIGRAMMGRPEHPSPDQGPEADVDDAPPPTDDVPPPERDMPAHPDPQRTPAPAGHPLDRAPRPTSPRRRRRHGLTVHAHLHTDAVTGATDAVYHLPGLGVVAEEAFQRWLTTYAVKVTRVIDLNRRHAVDQHDPPALMRDQVKERDGHCVFPGCEVPADSCDVDHIVPYDEDGPPGQTNPDGLACLCRMHHLLKTHHGWRYGRLSDGAYLWVSPTGRTFLVTRDGTDWSLACTRRTAGSGSR
jgi:5-methylcytosine-specific restriction endonuclease McrA